MFKSNVLRVRSCGDRLWELEEEIVYQGKDELFTIPVGFKTDFASVPAAVQWLIPSYGKYTLAAIVHDQFCDQLNYYYSQVRTHILSIEQGLVPNDESAPVAPSPTARETDAIFRRIMRELGVPPLRRRLIWTGVRWGALKNPARREGWWRDAPAVLGFSLLSAPVVVPATIFAGVGLFIDKAAEKIVGFFGGK
jgi:hypothetical protein